MLHSLGDQHDPTVRPLAIYVGELRGYLQQAERYRDELERWSDLSSGRANQKAQKVRVEHGFRDDVIRASLRQSLIVTMNMVVDDKQSKCFGLIAKKFSDCELSIVVNELYDPLWVDFKQSHAADLERLRVNRNNSAAHITKGDAQVADVLQFEPGSDGAEHQAVFGVTTSAPHNIIGSSDLLGGVHLFKPTSFRYLNGLLSILSFAQEVEIQASMEADIAGHIENFRTQFPID